MTPWVPEPLRHQTAAIVLAATVLAGASCTFERRSPNFECKTVLDCEVGRTCDRGWCVINLTPDAPPPVADALEADADAPPALDASLDASVDAFSCPSSCTRCELGICLIDCPTASACASMVVCPAGVPCRVTCDGSACAGGVDCSAAKSCRIECAGTDACAGLITCGPGVCRVECGGAGSCGGGIYCQESCMCDTLCEGTGSCATAPTCRPLPKCSNGIECTSLPGGFECNAC